MTAQIPSTFGGLRVDARSRVLDTDGDPIPGLHTVGEVTGHVHDRHLAATSVLRALTFGWIAGQEVAATLAGSTTEPTTSDESAAPGFPPDDPPTQAWAGVFPARDR